MKLKLPIIGSIRTGKDTETPKQTNQKDMSLGGFLELGQKKLSTEKSVSEKLVEACVGWVYINSSTLAEEVSKCEIKLYQSRYSGGELELAEVETHPILDLLDRFNDTTTSSDAFYLTESFLNLTGDAFWYLAGGQQPTDIFLLRPDKMELKLGDINDASRRLVEGYTYKDVIDGENVETDYKPEEIIQFKVPNPRNPYRGQSAVEAVANDIDTENYAGVTLREFFENGMIVQFALSTDQRLNNDQIKNFQSQLKSAYGGARNAWKVPIFGGGIKPVELQMSSKDMELLKQMTYLRDKIMLAFKNTPSSLGIVEDVNRANAESSILTWKQTVIQPKIQRVVDVLNEFLVPRYGDNLILGYESVVPEDEAADDDRAINLYKGGLITRDEARAIIEYDNVPGGNQFNSSGFNAITDPTQLPQPIKNVNWQRMFRKTGVFAKYKEYKTDWDKLMPVAKQYIKSKIKEPKIEPVAEKPKYSFDWEKVNKYADNQLKIVDMHEQIFRGKIEQIINGMVTEAISKVDDPNARKSKKIINKEYWLSETKRKVEPTLEAVLILAGTEANKLIGIDNPYIPKSIKTVDAKKFIRQQIELFAGSMIDTDIDILTEIIAAGLVEEMSVAQIRKQITDKFDEYSKSQAERITRTEVIKTSNLGAQDAFEQSGVVEAKQWLATEDDRTDEDCLAMDGEIVGLGDSYDSTIGKLLPDSAESILSYSSVEYPPLHCNCRCVLLPVLIDTKALKPNKRLYEQINKLEAQIDKRTKDYKQLKADKIDDQAYIKSLEKYLGVSDEPRG